jgi:hypothetical protein
MDNRFDELAKALAEGVSRREALRRLGGGLLTAMLASLGLETAWGQGRGGGGGGGSSFTKCSTYCNKLPRPQRSNCNSACQQCGGNTDHLCPSTDSDKVACCSQGQTCVGGTCAACPQGQALCGVTCCPLTQVCCNGVCCGAGQTCISSMCQANSNCQPTNGPCQVNDDCCSMSCNPMMGVCF